MKANELMIGDWVSFLPEIKEGEYSYLGEPRNVQVDLPCLERIDELLFAPIPLTAKILEKNGFEQDYSYDECVADGCFVEVKGWSYKAENILIQWDGITCEITNDLGVLCEEVTLNDGYTGGIKVHELQHALRLCGLNDLADNFKV